MKKINGVLVLCCLMINMVKTIGMIPERTNTTTSHPNYHAEKATILGEFNKTNEILNQERNELHLSILNKNSEMNSLNEKLKPIHKFNEKWKNVSRKTGINYVHPDTKSLLLQKKDIETERNSLELQTKNLETLKQENHQRTAEALNNLNARYPQDFTTPESGALSIN